MACTAPLMCPDECVKWKEQSRRVVGMAKTDASSQMRAEGTGRGGERLPSVLLGDFCRKRGLKARRARTGPDAQGRKVDKYPQAPSHAGAKCGEALQVGPSRENGGGGEREGGRAKGERERESRNSKSKADGLHRGQKHREAS